MERAIKILKPNFVTEGSREPWEGNPESLLQGWGGIGLGDGRRLRWRTRGLESQDRALGCPRCLSGAAGCSGLLPRPRLGPSLAGLAPPHVPEPLRSSSATPPGSGRRDEARVLGWGDGRGVPQREVTGTGSLSAPSLRGPDSSAVGTNAGGSSPTLR
jgi:hypothetical protein